MSQGYLIDKPKYKANTLLGQMIIFVGIVNVLELVTKALIRYFNQGNPQVISGEEGFVGIIRMVIVIVAYAFCAYKMSRMIKRNSGPRKLLGIWGVIFIPIQIINDFCVLLYTRMLQIVEYVLVQSEIDTDGQLYALIYDSTHGFKYICIFLAILLGVIVTAVILERRFLVWFSLIYATAFMVAFTIFRMQSFNLAALNNITIGINWTSLIFHVLTTLGLFFVGLYIYMLYRPTKEATEES